MGKYKTRPQMRLLLKISEGTIYQIQIDIYIYIYITYDLTYISLYNNMIVNRI